MHRSVAVAFAFALGLSAFTSAAPALADKSAITLTRKAQDVTVTVHGVTDYCSTNASTDVVRHGDTIRIIRDRPSRVSRCITSQDLTVVIHDVPAGTYRITYEQIPYTAPARALTLASTTVRVTD